MNGNPLGVNWMSIGCLVDKQLLDIHYSIGRASIGRPVCLLLYCSIVQCLNWTSLVYIVCVLSIGHGYTFLDFVICPFCPLCPLCPLYPLLSLCPLCPFDMDILFWILLNVPCVHWAHCVYCTHWPILFIVSIVSIGPIGPIVPNYRYYRNYQTAFGSCVHWAQ